jgi:hypothetical protein
MVKIAALMLVIGMFASTNLQAQSIDSTSIASVAANSDWAMPRTEYGHPDLQGTWQFGSRTPLQRSPKLGDKRSYTADEVRTLEQSMLVRNQRLAQPLDASRPPPEQGAHIGQEADDEFLAHFQEPVIVAVDGEHRTSVIIEPSNGRLPLREGFKDFHAMVRAKELTETDGPEGQPLSGRCLMFGAALPSLTPIMMNANLQIVQNKNYVMIMTEMAHDVRIIRLEAEHFDHGIGTWMGDSVGYWQDDTLVVHSKNFRPEQSSPRGMLLSEDFEVTEYYRIVADSEIRYGFTVTDEQAFTQPVAGVRMLTRSPAGEQIYEFACHEGNYSLPGILAGARRLESEK